MAMVLGLLLFSVSMAVMQLMHPRQKRPRPGAEELTCADGACPAALPAPSPSATTAVNSPSAAPMAVSSSASQL